MGKLRKRVVAFSVVYVAVAVVALWLAHQTFFAERAPLDVTYSEMLRELRAGHITKVELREREILAELRRRPGQRAAEEPRPIVAQRLPHIDETALLQEMERRGVVFSGQIDVSPWWETALLGWLLPIGVIVLIYALVYRKFRRSSGPMMLGGRDNVKIYDGSDEAKVTFDDVAGVDEALGELREIVDYLKNPQKYESLGARAPKGVLLVGPPGTGKTLLAKAVAGEAGVHFFSVSAPAFVEMFVGVGAARMRKLFEQARQRAPCIVFIDELDAIGKSRGGGSPHGGHDEREQTLNQLLIEMDGFDSSAGVILMAATNRPETLDAALLRAGRFDRTVVVDRPNIGEREAILRVHAKRAQIAADVDLRVIAQRTPGMVGADLANLVNEAALAAARHGSPLVRAVDFEEAVDRLQLGLKKQKRVMTEDERRRVAFHEGGHTLVALSVDRADPVHRVSIIPRSIGALGVTLQLPEEERYMMTRIELLDRICVMLGGRAAEELVFGELSTGAENDLERASETARRMVCRFGMSDKLGPLSFGRQGARFLEATHEVEARSFSEDTARAIDAEVRHLIETQYQRAVEILRRRRMVLHRIADELLQKETLEREELASILRESRSPPRPSHDAN